MKLNYELTQNIHGEDVYGVVINNVCIFNLRYDDSGRFQVNPIEYYGVTMKDVESLEALNDTYNYDYSI